MKIRQEISKRAFDGKFVLWQKMQVEPQEKVEADCFAAGGAMGVPEAAYLLRWAPFERWVARGVFPSFQEAAIAEEAFRKSAKAPLWAGDGSGSASVARSA